MYIPFTPDPNFPKRRYLRVEPIPDDSFPDRPNPAGQIVFSPPPAAMPWGLGHTYHPYDIYAGKVRNVPLDAWILEEGEGKPINLRYSILPVRRDDIYMEKCFSRSAHITLGMLLFWVSLPYIFLLLYSLCVKSVWWVVTGCSISLFLVWTIYFFSFRQRNKPTILFNRLRREIYICSEESDHLLIQNFDNTKFVLQVSSSRYTYVFFYNSPHPKTKNEAYYIDRTEKRGYSYWEYIRRYMEPGEGYKSLPVMSDKLPFYAIIQRMLQYECKLFSLPHRWPPEIEMLLWPENKDAPLPEGWQYDTWIPYVVPSGGFDNTELLREREERLGRGGAQDRQTP
jgi:hypothetical protein